MHEITGEDVWKLLLSKKECILLFYSMTNHFENNDLINGSHFMHPCTCQHCMGIRMQQQQSELEWLKEHQLFDRWITCLTNDVFENFMGDTGIEPVTPTVSR